MKYDLGEGKKQHARIIVVIRSLFVNCEVWNQKIIMSFKIQFKLQLFASKFVHCLFSKHQARRTCEEFFAALAHAVRYNVMIMSSKKRIKTNKTFLSILPGKSAIRYLRTRKAEYRKHVLEKLLSASCMKLQSWRKIFSRFQVNLFSLLVFDFRDHLKWE